MPEKTRLGLFLDKIWIGPLTGCWYWTGAIRRWSREPWDGGYGAFWDGERVVRAHVWFYRQLVGEIPAGKVLLHECDNRRCVNVVRHIRPGTQRQNVADMLAKGRSIHQRRKATILQGGSIAESTTPEGPSESVRADGPIEVGPAAAREGASHDQSDPRDARSEV